MDAMTIHVEAAPEAASDDARASSANDLAKHIKGVVGVSCKIDVKEPGGIERSMGKAVRVVDKR